MQLSVDATGVTHLRETIDQLGPRSTKAASLAVKKAARDIKRIAKRRVPVDTGYLKSSIGVTLGEHGLIAVIGPHANYGAYVEYGDAGRKPRPYMMPALEAVRPGFEKAIKEIVAEAFQ